MCDQCEHECTAKPPEETPEPPNDTVAIHEEIQRANETARVQKKELRKGLSYGAPTLPDNNPAVCVEDAAPTKNVSKRAHRRQAKKHEQRLIQEKRVGRSTQRDDEEFLKIVERVSRLNEEVGTVVKEDLESLESVQALEVALRKEATGSQHKSKNKRQREVCEDVEVAIAQLNLWNASMKCGC